MRILFYTFDSNEYFWGQIKIPRETTIEIYLIQRTNDAVLR